MRHGGDLSEAMARFGGGRADWLDLSTGINPHAFEPGEVPARFLRALPARADLEALLAVARRAYRIPADIGVAAAPGTQALIQWLPRLMPAGAVAVLGPTYAEHALAARAAGRDVQEIEDPAQWSGAPNLALVNPNNPDGRLVGPEALLALGREAGRRGGWLVVDESFVDTVPERTAVHLCARAPVIVLRSFGKFYGLAGLRLGFLAAAVPIAEAAAAALGPWAVAGPALAIGRGALEDEAWAAAMRGRLAGEAAALDAVLERRGLAVVGGTALYRLARHPAAEALHRRLAERRIWTRRFEDRPGLLRFGLPGGAGGLARLDAALAAAHASPQGSTAVSPPAV